MSGQPESLNERIKMQSRNERYKFWCDFLLQNLFWQGVLQRRLPGTRAGSASWRLRWREYGKDGKVIHHSKAVPEADVEIVQKGLEWLKNKKQDYKAAKKGIQQRSLELKEKYRRYRRKILDEFPVSRRRKIAAQQQYDFYCALMPANPETAYIMAITGSIGKRRGRPYGSTKVAMHNRSRIKSAYSNALSEF